MYHSFLIHSSVNEHLGCFHVLTTLNSTVMNTGIHVSFRIVVFSEYRPNSRIAGSCVVLWMDCDSVIQSEVSQKEKNKYHILMHTYGIQKNGTDESICRAEIEPQIEQICGLSRGRRQRNELREWTESQTPSHVKQTTVGGARPHRQLHQAPRGPTGWAGRWGRFQRKGTRAYAQSQLLPVLVGQKATQAITRQTNNKENRK